MPPESLKNNQQSSGSLPPFPNQSRGYTPDPMMTSVASALQNDEIIKKNISRRSFLATAALGVVGGSLAWNFYEDWKNHGRSGAFAAEVLSAKEIDENLSKGKEGIPTSQAVKDFVENRAQVIEQKITKVTNVTGPKAARDITYAGSPTTINATNVQSALDSLDTAIKKLTTDLIAKADKTHTHAIADVTGLQGSLDSKASVASVNNLTLQVASKADSTDPRLTNARTPTAHAHPLSEITNSGASSGQVPQWNGSAWVPASVIGTGDMTKTVYDPDNDGKVVSAVTADNALNLGGQPAANYATNSTVTTQLATKENSLGNPSLNGQVLASTTAGVRSWVTLPSGGGLSVPGSNGFVSHTGSGATQARTITGGLGVSVTNGDGVSGNPTIAVNESALNLANIGGTLNVSTQASGVLPITNGGTGSSTQNFVDLTTAQTILGNKTFTNNLIVNGDTTLGNASTDTVLVGGTIDSPSVSAHRLRFEYADQTGFPSASTYHGAIAHSHADGALYFAHAGSWVPLANSNLANVTGTLPINRGGTGATTAVAALNNLLPSQTGNGGRFLTTDGSGTISWAAIAGGGMSSIGVIDSQTKSANGAVNNSGSLVMQTADASNPGLVSTAAQTFAGDKTFNGDIIAQTGVTVNGLGTALTVANAASVGGNFTVSGATLLNATFNQAGMAAPGLSSGGQGRIYFDSGTNKFRVSENGGAFVDLLGGGGGGVTSVGPIGAGNANGGSVSGTVLTLHEATATQPGIISTAAQTLAGVKTFANNIALSAGLVAQSTTGTNGQKLTSTGTGVQWRSDGLVFSGTGRWSDTGTVNTGGATGNWSFVNFFLANAGSGSPAFSAIAVGTKIKSKGVLTGAYSTTTCFRGNVSDFGGGGTWSARSVTGSGFSTTRTLPINTGGSGPTTDWGFSFAPGDYFMNVEVNLTKSGATTCFGVVIIQLIGTASTTTYSYHINGTGITTGAIFVDLPFYFFPTSGSNLNYTHALEYGEVRYEEP